MHYLQINHHLPRSGWKPTDWPAWLLFSLIILAAHLYCLPVTQENNKQFRHQAGHNQQDAGYISISKFHSLQVRGSGRFSQLMPYYDSGINLIGALEGYSSWQVLMQTAMNSIQEFNGTNREATIPWLDHVKAIAKKTGFNPLEVSVNRLKGTTLCNVNTISKEGNFSYFWFHQLLIEHYSNIPYASDTLNAYAHLMQGENEMVTQYVARVKVCLEHINHTSKSFDIPGRGYDNLYLVWGLCSPHF